jgi:SAM-dependent methyltransferase
MSDADIAQYLQATKDRPVREDLKFAVSRIDGARTAVDCGCGAGADINYLLHNGFRVYAFDVDDQALSVCRTRFQDSKDVVLSKASFETFAYPAASLVVADASLFFCPPDQFSSVWRKIYECLLPGGIFCGSLLGREDTMAQPGDNPSVFWSHVSAFDQSDVEYLLNSYEVLRFNVHRSSGKTAGDVPHDWHIFQIVARKPAG